MGWLARRAERRKHNDRDFFCRYWWGDRSGSLVGLDKETCTICREER